MYSNSFIFPELIKIHAKEFSKVLTNNEIYMHLKSLVVPSEKLNKTRYDNRQQPCQPFGTKVKGVVK